MYIQRGRQATGRGKARQARQPHTWVGRTSWGSQVSPGNRRRRFKGEKMGHQSNKHMGIQSQHKKKEGRNAGQCLVYGVVAGR